MEIVFKTLLRLHILAGFGSLLLFWIPIFLKKGSKNHILVGKIYVKLMWVVVVTAASLSIKNLYIGELNMALFLGFISLITANPLWYGIAVLRKKKDSKKYQFKHFIFKSTIVIFSLGLIAYGVFLNGEGSAILMFMFGCLGLADLPSILRTIKGKNKEINGLKEHIVGMCVSGIAAYTAFFVFGSREFIQSILPGYLSIIPWVAPTVIGFIGIKIAVNKYIH